MRPVKQPWELLIRNVEFRVNPCVGTLAQNIPHHTDYCAPGRARRSHSQLFAYGALPRPMLTY